MLLATIVFGSLADSALGNMYSCQDVAGRIILRDVPCKRGENSRDGVAEGWGSKVPSSPGRGAASADQISEGQVQALLEAMDAAMARRDVNAVLGYLASDAVWELEYRLPQGLQFLRLTKDDYAARLREDAPLMTAPQPERENTRILIAPGARYAELTSTLRETIRIQGEPLRGLTRSRSTVEMRKGRPVITLVRATTTFDVSQGKDDSGKQKAPGPEARR